VITTKDVGKRVVIKLQKKDLHYGEVYNNLTGILTKLYGFRECCIKLDQSSIRVVKDYNNKYNHGYILTPCMSSESVFIFNEKKVLDNE
jgi:hypothetical protein